MQRPKFYPTLEVLGADKGDRIAEGRPQIHDKFSSYPRTYVPGGQPSDSNQANDRDRCADKKWPCCPVAV